ncbi:hypothetical protein GCM10009007_20380 [Formosimonas limnophila]|uniref:CobW C-terminal domain-containing protein n=1 Tax=Formosimonas limnophila TaxID=1384487 RepID=A0A8J3G0G8_9BURK|nr:GTP-binding protein [Formosimonas limnophila]GHA79255.1 hypothetical protein GCM10009007_20380 [Formosimonas limnophila]
MKTPLSVALWFENQNDIDFNPRIPMWARQLAQAHMDQTIRVVAHEHTAYARGGLSCHVMKGEVVYDDDVDNQVTLRVTNAQATSAQKLIFILPARASVALWVQRMLMDLPSHGAKFDEVLMLMQLDRLWDNLPDGLARERMLFADRVLSFDGDVYKPDFVPYMRAVNPLAVWIDDGFSQDADLLLPIHAYASDAPQWRQPIKKADSDAWGTRKVVYLSFELQLDGEKLRHVLDDWRAQYANQLLRLQAMICLKSEPSPLYVQSICHLWAVDLVGFWQGIDAPKTQFWLWGHDLPVAQMRAQIEACTA